MIFAQGKLLPDTQGKALLEGLEARLNAVWAGPPLEAETVIAAVDALGRRLERGEFDALLARFLPAGRGLGELLLLRRLDHQGKADVARHDEGGKYHQSLVKSHGYRRRPAPPVLLAGGRSPSGRSLPGGGTAGGRPVTAVSPPPV